MGKKNILLFRWENTRDLLQTVRSWRERFIEKYGEMNLLDIDRDNIPWEILTDCMAPGFMGSSRMVIFRDKLMKTAREIKNMEEKAGKTIDLDEDEDEEKEDSDTAWIKMCESLPETNFLLFIGNKKPSSDLESWLEKHATIHDFASPTPRAMQLFAIKELWLNEIQAEIFCQQLGFYEENLYGKMVTIGKPDYIYQEIEKLKLTGKKEWANSELKAILPDYRDENSFNMLNPLWDRQSQEMISTWQRLIDTADHELTMASIITMIRKILICATFPNIGDIPVTRGQKTTGSKLRNEQKALKKLYDNIIAVDIAEKSGELPHKTNAFLMALLSYC